MKENLSPKDWEALSAFLDNELSENDSENLEFRIQNDEEFESAFRSLTRVSSLLRLQPSLRAPRNFVLNPAEYGSGKKEGSIFGRSSFWSFVSASAALLLILVFAGDMFVGSNIGTQFSPQSAMQVQSEAVEPAEILEVESALEMDAGMMEAPAAEKDTSPILPEASPQRSLDKAAIPRPTQEIQKNDFQSEETTSEETSSDADEEAEIVFSDSIADEYLREGNVILEPSSQLENTNFLLTLLSKVEPSVYRLIEVLLLLAVLFTGVKAFITHKKKKGHS